MSTRKSTVTSPTAAHGTKLEHASTSSSKSLDKGIASSLSEDKAEMGTNAFNNTNIPNNTEPKATEQIQKTNQQDTKPFQQRVTRNSPLLLASPNAGITIKKEPLDSNDHQTNSESEEVEGTNTTKKPNARGRKPLKEQKELVEREDKLDELENKDKNKEKEEKDKDKDKNIESANSATASNRLTRKSVANQEAAKTRVTRHRQSSGAGARSETPPAKGRGRGVGRGKMPVPMLEPTLAVTKRKRSLDVDNCGSMKSAIDEPGAKYIKIEVKDPDLENEDLLLSSQNTNASTESSEIPLIKIKQELIDESENELQLTTENIAATANPSSLLSVAATTSVGRGRGRNPNRKTITNNTHSSTSNTHISPSTRATRQTKHNSPVQATTSATPDMKRRRMGSQTRSLLKTSVGNICKNQPTNAEEEDSKDSMASTNTDDIVLALIKSEKISMEMDDDNTNDTKDLLHAPQKETNNENLNNLEETSDLPPPLVVDTDVTPSTNAENEEILENSALTPVTASCSSVASGSEKAASLSPSELVSEGVSEISVKQFYKKPKFLENNLGIEEDPKLGNIVQKAAGLETATTSSTTTTTIATPASTVSTSFADVLNKTTTLTTASLNVSLPDDTCSNESLKEGTLQFDETLEDKNSSIQDDNNSLSSEDNDTPLLIVEDDEDELNDQEEELLGELSGNEVKEDQVEKNIPKNEQTQITTAKPVTDKEKESKETAKLAEIELVDENLAKADEQEDELTLEESETISMDNNASINDEILTEIEDPVNDLENTADLNQIKENISSQLCSANKNAIQQLTNKSSSPNETGENVKETLKQMEELFATGKEAEKDKLLVNSKIQLPTTVTAVATAEDDADNDVLAKIDAELKKIDLRSKEKQTIRNIENSERLSIVDVSLKAASIDDSYITTPTDVDGKIKVKDSQEDKENVVKNLAIVDDEVLDIKLDDEHALIIDEDIKLTDVKLKSDDDKEDVGFSSNMDKNEKADINKKELLKSSTLATALEILNGKPSTTSISGSSPIKAAGLAVTTTITTLKDDDTTSMKSGQSTTSWITLDLENDDEDSLRKKELHLQNLGLVTHKAAEKRRQEVIQSSAANVEASKVAATQHQQNNKRNGKNSSHAATTHHEYTGTLKTIIKINRNSTGSGTNAGNNGRKNQNNATAATTSKDQQQQQQQQRRQSLKMTFQKGRARAHGTSNNDRSQPDREGHGEDSYYTIQNETEGALQKFHNFPTTSTTSLTRLALTHTNKYNNNNNIVKNLTTTYARKSYNYRYNHQHHHTHSNNSNKTAHIFEMDSSNSESHDHLAGGVTNKKDEKEEILIPEKASSFKFHPGRLCEDQCFYCSGKFGLYDTPCHVGQIKSMERQQKILANEEKLTVDNCLCDACFRHVDRRANVPSYKKRLSAPGHLESLASTSSKSLENSHFDNQHNNETEGQEGLNTNSPSRKCLVPDCTHPASHSLRRKCIRKSVKKFLLKFEIPASAACVWLCQSHYDTVIQCSGCVLCKRRLGKNHMYHITSDTDRLEKALCEMGIPVQLGFGTAVCKLCRYFANLLMKPPDSTKSQKAEFVKNYRKRLLQFHNIHDGSNDPSEADEDDSNSATNHENPELTEKSTRMDPESGVDTLTTQKDDKTVDTPSVALAENPLHSDNSNSNSSEKTATKPIERDFDTAGISTDSSNSSTVSNTATNSPSEMSKLKAILQSNAAAADKPTATNNDISNALRANPNISMRELFPGEEDLGLQFKVPFGGSGSQRTPEGWTRVQTFLQYDEPTRRLWEELQKPYGNQSSFLRHLILLEKYFRNGDLILSASASNNASVYTQTVRQRLTSYDKGHCGGLHIGTGVPKENKNSANNTAGCSKTSSSSLKAKEIDPKIPTFVINEDDDDEEEEDSDDQDVEMTLVEKLPKPSNPAATTASASHKESNTIQQQHKQQLQRSRSLSVDKLTKQLSSNAVTITARSKDPSLSTTNSSKRATPSPQKSLLKDNLIQQASNSTINTNSANLAAANAAAAVALAASTASAASASAGGPSNSRSILKCNLLGINKSVEILPISCSATTTITKTSTNSNPPPPPPPPPPTANIPAPPPPVAETKQQKILEVANKLLGNHLEAVANSQNKNQASLLSSPPELVSLQRRSAGQVTAGQATANTNNNNNNHNHSQQSTNLPKRPQLLVKPGTSRPPPNVVILPDTLTPQERLQSKTWRPTLMPVEENHNLLNKNGPLYQTADGRRLPALVQVQSGGKPFLISIFDYNRMCILRREKLMRDQMLKATKKRLESKQQQQQQQQHHHHQQQQQQQQQQNHAQQQQQQQQHHLQNQQLQKTNLQNMNKNYQTAAASQQRQQHQQQQQQHQQHQQQQQQQNAEQQRLLQYQILEHQQALIKAATAALNTPNSQHAAAAAAAMRYQSILPKPPATSNITTMPPLQAPHNTNANFNTPMMPLLASAITNAANTGNVNPAPSATPTHNNTSWLWNNFPDANQLLLNGGGGSAVGGGSNNAANVPKLPQLLAKSNNPASNLTNASNAAKLQQQQQLQHQQQQYLLSKIPKSLTVIPQHKLMNNNNHTNTGPASGPTSGNLMKE